MDRKSIIGLVLIFGIFIGYMWWVSPSKEELARMQAERDSILSAYVDSMVQDSIAKEQAAAQMQHLRDSIAEVNPEALATFEAEASGMVTLAQRQEGLGCFGGNVALTNNTITVENSRFTVTLSNLGAQVDKVVLRNHVTFDNQPLTLISPSQGNMNMVFPTSDNNVVNTNEMNFAAYVNGTPVEGSQTIEVEKDSVVVAYRAYADSLGEAYLEYEYTFFPESYEVGFKVNFHGLKNIVRADQGYVDFVWRNQMNRQERVDPSARGKANPNKDREKFYSNVYWRPIGDKVDELKTARDDQRQVNTKLDWVAFKQQFFCAILMNDNGFENANLALSNSREKDTAASYLCDMSSTLGLAYDSERDCSVDMSFFFGPSKFRTLKDMDKGFEHMLSHGKFFLVRWTSRLLITCLNFFEQFNWNYGLIIILITFILRNIVLFPLTYNSYKSSAITRILRPEMEALAKKYPNQDQALQKSQAMSQLQKSAGINPVMGCLPILIQMPILFAMFRFIPTAVEFRQQSFLWCHDISNYDSILNFGFNIPLYGDHISLFCLLMFGMQFFYTWYTMKSTPAQASMPGMKFMMYFMPFMMLFIFNSQSAALNIYYCFSLMCTMAQMILIRKFTSEKKVRARMAAYQLKQQQNKGKKGNGKKSKWQQRLEEMQKMAEQQQKMQQNRR
mgnify:FL=1